MPEHLFIRDWRPSRKIHDNMETIAPSLTPHEASSDDYTREELLVLASIRRDSGRTCRNCVWLSVRGRHRGCFPDGKYRKFLSEEEYDSGCPRFKPADESAGARI